MSLFLKLFLANGIPFGILMGVARGVGFLSPQGDIRSAIIMGLISGIIFGLLMAFALIGMNKFMMRKRPAGDHGAGPRCSETFAVTAPADAMFDKAVAALKALRVRIGRKDKEQGEIIGHTRPSFRSWGERVTVRIAALTGDGATVTVSSAPVLSFTMIDYGKGLENVRNLAARLKA